MATMTLDEALKQLESLGNEKCVGRTRRGAGDNQFGVQLGDIRKFAAEIKTDHELAIALWGPGIRRPPPGHPPDQAKEPVSAPRWIGWFGPSTFAQLADWLNAYVVKEHPDKEALRQEWMAADDPWAARAGWSLTAERIAKSPEGLDLPALLERIESEMGGAAPEVQWTMNSCLAAIGIHFPALRKRAIAIGEALGIYRDYPVSKGCTSPFAPIWINEMVRRQK